MYIVKKHFNEDLYYPIVALLLGIVRLLPDSGTWWVTIETVVDLILIVIAVLSLVVLLKTGTEGKLKTAAMILACLALADFSVFAILQLVGIQTGSWNTVGAVVGLALGVISLAVTIVHLLQKKSKAKK